MAGKQQEVLGVIIIASLMISLSLLLWFGKKEEYSQSERRKLEEFPEITVENLANGRFGAEFEEYTLDHFPFREGFRAVKTLFSGFIFQNKVQNGLYKKEGYLAKMEYPLNKENVEYGIGKIKDIYELFLKDKNVRCYLSIIPDKNYFLAPKYGLLSLDYDFFFQEIPKSLPFAEYLDITGLLSLQDYYKTDTHWRQENITDVAEYLGKKMGVWVEGVYEKRKLDQPFYGVYAGQWSLPVKGEDLYYLTNDILDQCQVYYVGENEKAVGEIYDLKKGKEKDPYDLFLSGANAIMTIENPSLKEEKELIVFRDSFGSSLIPLLAGSYSKITLVDIRYVQSRILDHYIEFKNQDVLFLYSTLILNQSRSFK